MEENLFDGFAGGRGWWRQQTSPSPAVRITEGVTLTPQRSGIGGYEVLLVKGAHPPS